MVQRNGFSTILDKLTEGSFLLEIVIQYFFFFESLLYNAYIMYYRNEMGYNYPDISDQHMLQVKKKRKVIVDENYSFIDRSFSFRFKQFWLRLGITCLVFPLLRIAFGLKIHNKKILKQNKNLFKNGAITISNHVFMWDYLAILRVIWPKFPHFPAWKTNLEGSNASLIRLVGGIPIPTDSIKGMSVFTKVLDDELNKHHWLHFFPEGSMWYYYPDIRPLKPGVFHLAVKHNKPIIPMSFSFRKRRGIFRLFRNNKLPCVELHIGEPILPNLELDFHSAVLEMQKEAYHVMQGLAGIHPGDPTYNVDQNIANYHKTM